MLVTFAELISTIDGYIWGAPLMVLLVGTGLYLTVRMRGVQLRGFSHAIRVLRGCYDREEDAGEITHFQALTAALSATIGTGNIVGVAAAILTGGPGAAFWMWVTALVGMATKFTSCTLAVHFRRIDEHGEAHGGPMHFIELGMGKRFKWLAVLFAAFTVTASFGIGNMFQINNCAVSLNALIRPGSTATPAFNLVVGVVVATMVAGVILGGIKRIGRFASELVPLMCFVYVAGALYILVRHHAEIPGAFGTILYHAFHKPEALAGGFLGTVIRSGVSRGLFSNEAGMGSAAMVHGAARTDEPVREGLVAMLGPFVDTIVICTMTALVIVITGAYETCAIKGELTGRAFELGMGHPIGARIVSIGVVLFSFSTLVSWSYYGDRAADYLLGPRAVLPYRLLYIGFIVLGAVVSIGTIIDFCDAMNGLMAVPNLIALVVLSPIVAKLTRDYFRRMHAPDTQ
ncbi:MAG: sodium:alanine symporter family protein [Verrucomicrobia bacterium]|jgi:alanine or glycine:cation symporter, AGCS family|nr:sodium:alanine symporter family protein [Verrucomicrobiota bacterium]